MKYLKSIMIITLIVSCKSDIKREKEQDNTVQEERTVDQSVYDLWHSFTSSYPEFKTTNLPDSWFFHDNEYDANRLADLVVSGKKQAGSGLYAWYEAANADLPKVGTKHIITNFDGKARAIIEVVKVDTIPFNKVTKDYAKLDMGTDVEPLEKWKKAHWEFFASAMKESGQELTEDILVVCETYKTLWPEN